MNKKIYKKFIFILFLLTLSVNVFPKQKNNSKNITTPQNIYNITGILNNDLNSINKVYFINGTNLTSSKNKTTLVSKNIYNITGISGNDLSSTSKVYFITGTGFTNTKKIKNNNNQKHLLSQPAMAGTIYNINGSNINSNSSNKIYLVTGKNLRDPKTKWNLTKIQKAKLEYLEMEEESKLIALGNELKLRQRLLDDELSKQDFNEYIINNLLTDIKYLTTDIEQVKFDKKRKTRYLLSQEQYIQYESKLQNKQKKKKKKKSN
ncbi:MAG: hypothetical protein PHG84_01365 [Endomicrobiaceae bacterium]|nr:hypothetical protein [Endomicrobiaceae bacterium]